MRGISIIIDDSEDYLGIVIGNDLVLGGLLAHPIKQHVGKTVHMKELSKSMKCSVAKLFVETCLELREKYSLRLVCGKREKLISQLRSFIETSIKQRRELPPFYVDRGIEVLLRKIIHPFYFRFLTIYVDKDRSLCADILAWINLRGNQSKFIWNKIANQIEELNIG
jgi:hypothetical protein